MKFIKFDNEMRASYSFALEELIMTSPQLTEEYFLFWRTNPTLMIGRFQNTYNEINKKYVDENNVNVVRRNSGGGTIYTDGNCWQYSFITWKEAGKIKDFRLFTKPVIDALSKLGLNAEFSGRNDLLVDGKKFSGNAQCSFRDRFLHHGTILFDTNIDNLQNSITINEDKIISKGVTSIRDRVTNIKPYLNKEMSSIEFYSEFLKLISEKMEVIFLSDDIFSDAKKIEKEKFLTFDWNYGKSPEFNITKSKRFFGGKIENHLFVQNGLITNCYISGDFFLDGDISIIQKAVIGTRYEKKELKNALMKISHQNQFIMISFEEFLECFI
jgi:lipoate-protein ligase A